jgi:hypothetical protein
MLFSRAYQQLPVLQAMKRELLSPEPIKFKG